MLTVFQDSDRADGCGGYLETPKLGSWSWSECKKTVCGVCGQEHRIFYDRKTRRVRDLSCGDTRVYLEVEFRRVACRGCGLVKQEKLTWIADNPLYTKRFAFFVGRRCRSSTLNCDSQSRWPRIRVHLRGNILQIGMGDQATRCDRRGCGSD
jgi:hypothetical protein